METTYNHHKKFIEELSLRVLLHRLWTKAVGSIDYDKEEWKELEARIEKLTCTANIEYK